METTSYRLDVLGLPFGEVETTKFLYLVVQHKMIHYIQVTKH
jgi:hypothetical protein